MRVDLTTKTATQRQAWFKIMQIANSMLVCTDRGELFDLFCKAEDLYNDHFPFEASMDGDSWWLTRRYNNIDRMLAILDSERYFGQ